MVNKLPSCHLWMPADNKVPWVNGNGHDGDMLLPCVHCYYLSRILPVITAG